MSKSEPSELRAIKQVVVRQTGKAWVLVETREDGGQYKRAVSGLHLSLFDSGTIDVMPLDLGENNLRVYRTFDYAKSTVDNAGRIFFSSSNSKYEVRALLLEDADWLFPGQEFSDLELLNDAALRN